MYVWVVLGSNVHVGNAYPFPPLRRKIQSGAEIPDSFLDEITSDINGTIY